MVVGPVLGATVGLQSVALLGEATKTLPKQWWGPSTTRTRKVNARRAKPLVKGAVNILVGTSLLRPTATLVNQL